MKKEDHGARSVIWKSAYLVCLTPSVPAPAPQTVTMINSWIYQSISGSRLIAMGTTMASMEFSPRCHNWWITYTINVNSETTSAAVGKAWCSWSASVGYNNNHLLLLNSTHKLPLSGAAEQCDMHFVLPLKRKLKLKHNLCHLTRQREGKNYLNM